MITDPGQTAAAQELCNGLDDDCDNQIDEGSIDDVVPAAQLVERLSQEFHAAVTDMSRRFG